MATLEFIRGLVLDPRESLAVEMKAWIDPSSPEGQAKLVRCALAMRNYGGGFLIVGFDNASGAAVSKDRPSDLRAAFHIDKIQGLVTRFASTSFEIAVHFVERNGEEFPVIEVPAGVKSPVVSKSSLNDSAGKALIRDGRVYVRSLDSNNTPSSSEATWKDWDRLIETCFDNREADIGRFLRRHLSGLSPQSIRELASTLLETASPQESGETLLRKTLDEGLARFKAVASERSFDPPEHGSWEVSAAITGAVQSARADLSFLGALLSSNPHYTGWPVWLDSRNFGNEKARPYLVENAWEAMIASFGSGFSDHLDFWRLEPNGRFYLYRALQDDISVSDRHPPAMTAFDFGLPILRVAEALAVGAAFARALGCKSEDTSVSYAFRWRRLKGRELSSWAQPDRIMSPGRRAYREEVVSFVDVPLDTPLSALATFVGAATTALFEAFDGFVVPNSVVEDFTRRLFERRL